MSNNKEREAFERAIRDNPDDTAGYAAYADWLQEHDDPRGEFVAVQLALEDEKRPKKEREALKAHEAELLKAHEREWLGALAPYFLDPKEDLDVRKPVITNRWRRGFLAEVDVLCMTVGLAQAVCDSPASRLVREMRIRGSTHYYSMPDDEHSPRVPTPPGAGEHYGYFELIGSPCLESVRVFRTGSDDDEPPEDGWTSSCSCHLPGLEHVIVKMARVEELHLLCNDYDLGAVFALRNLTHLRVLRAYHVGRRRRDGGDSEYEYPLGVLAANPSLANLTHLQFHPHFAEDGYEGDERSYIPLDQVRALLRGKHLKKLTHLQLRLSDMGDEGVREIVASGILKRLKWLDLRHGCITDAGARLFAECPDARNLERLDLSRNAVSAAGLAVLRQAKVNAVANRPLTDPELESREYLREGDFE
jgi:uncharacterized protein (TIGR02996 family)